MGRIWALAGEWKVIRIKKIKLSISIGVSYPFFKLNMKLCDAARKSYLGKSRRLLNPSWPLGNGNTFARWRARFDLVASSRS